MLRRDFVAIMMGAVCPVWASSANSACSDGEEASGQIVTTERLARFSPRARVNLVRAIVTAWPTALTFGLTGNQRVQHFIAQLATETGGFVTIEENLSYSASRLRKVWPKRFPDDQTALAYARNPQGLAEYVYGGRLGNDMPGDGYKYRGSGYIQLTGKANFRTKTKGLGLSPSAVDAPDQLRQPSAGFVAALKFWNSIDGNSIADRDDVYSLRKRVNGGYNGIADTKIWIARARRFLTSSPLGPEEADSSSVEEIDAIQERLKELGILNGGPEEAVSPSRVVDALQQFREGQELVRKNIVGVPPNLGIALLYDEDVLYAITDPQLRVSEERDNG